IGLPMVALTSFISNAFTYTLGFGVLTGGAVRWRLYSSFALEPAKIVAVGALCALTFWLGVGSAAGLSLLLYPEALSPDGGRVALGLTVGLLIVAGVAAYVATTAVKPLTLSVSGWAMRLPGP